MNFGTTDELSDDLFCASFNHSATSLAVGDFCGYKIIDLDLLKSNQEVGMCLFYK